MARRSVPVNATVNVPVSVPAPVNVNEPVNEPVNVPVPVNVHAPGRLRASAAGARHVHCDRRRCLPGW